MTDPLISFLTLLAGPAPDTRLLEIRYRTNGRPGMGQHFINARAPIKASELIRPLSAHGDTYVGVLLRDRAEGGRRAVTNSHLLWVEIDADDAYKRLLSAPAAPTAVVSSGTPGHLHAYWLLGDAVSADQVAGLNRKLAGSVGGDLASVDPARILRPPATLNHKHHLTARTVLELLDHSRIYDATELIAGLLDPRPKAAYTTPVAPRRPPGPGGPWWQRVDEQLRQIPSAEYVPRLSGRQPTAEGKIRCPFHGNGRERTPSLQVYPPFEWACFGCQHGGSIYDFASHLWSIPTKGQGFRELRDRLADVYGIASDVNTQTQTPVPAGASR
jgi:CHC2-type zinc finger protein/DNA primase RepB-like protein